MLSILVYAESYKRLSIFAIQGRIHCLVFVKESVER
jgi:hypothetical protein